MARKKVVTARTTATAADAFNKTKNFNPDVLLDSVFLEAGVRKDPETAGIIQQVLPRFAEVSPRQAFTSLTKMVREIGKTSGFSGNASNGSDREIAGAAAHVERRRPGRPPGSKNKSTIESEKGQAAGEKRGPGRPKGSKNSHPR